MTTATFSLPPIGANGQSATPQSERDEQAARFYGSDIWLDVAAPDVQLGQARYVTTAAGDWALATGREALRQSLLRRLVTNPGDWQTKPDYGVGARQYGKAKNTSTMRAELESRIRSQFARDPRVHSIELVTIERLDSDAPGIKISIIVTPRGRLRSDQQLSVSMEVF
jgi:phage baseplate assembly protein W